MQNILQSFTPEEVRFFLEKQSELGGMALLELLIKKKIFTREEIAKEVIESTKMVFKKIEQQKAMKEQPKTQSKPTEQVNSDKKEVSEGEKNEKEL